MDDTKGINQDYLKRAIVQETSSTWHTSPSIGVKRMYLERDNFGEFAKATSIVKFDSKSSFSGHIHTNGEEFFVLEGTFSDEYGDYPEGSYVRNPNGTFHNPYSDKGCKIFVKLRQFNKLDTKRVVKNIQDTWSLSNSGIAFLNLHTFKNEISYLVRFKPHSKVILPFSGDGGQEILVISGAIYDQSIEYKKITWMRDSKCCLIDPYTRDQEVLMLVKTGHLL